MTTIVPAEPSNIEALAALAKEMDRFYGAAESEPLESRIAQISEAVFNDPPSAYALLAWDKGELVGFASYSFLWPAIGLTRSLYLKELYITEASRRKGIGKLLMQGLCDIAIKNDCSRLEWTTDQDNLQAQQFYDELEVPVMESKLFYRIEGDRLRRKATRK
jgi:GNAT superfamily N-acetyltransferase